MKKNLIFYSLLILSLSASSQGIFYKKFEAKQALIFDIAVKQQIPGGDLAKRFGNNSSLGLDINFKAKNNWIFGLGTHFMFGNEVKENGILDSIKGSTGELIDQNGQFSTIGYDQRGMYIGMNVGKIISFGGVNQNSGLVILLGGGYLQHKIRLFSTNTVPQLTDEYKKGYDRFTSGMATTQYIGYRFLDPKKRVNFSLGFELTEGFTQNRRSYNFDTRMADTQQRLDLLYSLKFAISVPLYLKKASEEEFFE